MTTNRKFIQSPLTLPPRKEVEQWAKQAGEEYLGMRVEYLQTLSIYDKCVSLIETFEHDANLAEEAIINQNTAKRKEAEEFEQRIADARTEIENLTPLHKEQEEFIAAKEREKAPLIKKFNQLVAARNLGDVEPSLLGIRTAIQAKHDAGDLTRLRAERDALLQKLEDMESQPKPSLSYEAIAELTDKKTWKSYLPLVGISLLPGILTGFSIGSAVGFVKHSIITRPKVDPGTIISVIFGIVLVSLLGAWAERLVLLAFDDKRRNSEVSSETKLYTGIFIFVLLLELLGDGIGLTMLFNRANAMGGANIPSYLAWPLGFLIAVPVVMIKVMMTSSSLRKYSTEVAPALDAEQVLRNRLTRIEADIKKSIEQDKEVDDYLKKWHAYGQVIDIVSSLDELKKEQNECQVKFDEYATKIQELNQRIERLSAIKRAKEQEIEIDPDTKEEFDQRREEIQKMYNNFLSSLNRGTGATS